MRFRTETIEGASRPFPPKSALAPSVRSGSGNGARRMRTVLPLLALLALCDALPSCATGPERKHSISDADGIHVDFSIPRHPYYEVSDDGDAGASGMGTDGIRFPDPALNASIVSLNSRANADEDIRQTVGRMFRNSLAQPDGASANSSIVEYRYSDGRIYPLLVSDSMMTDLRLEGGEEIAGELAVSDPSMLIVDPALSMENGQETVHLLLRSATSQGQATMILPTSRRTYYFQITATDGKGMFGVRFKYGKSGLIRSGRNGEDEALTGLRDLDFGYSVSGSREISPVAVFSDGKSTYIQFPKEFYSSDMNPALYLVDDNGTGIINYTIRGNMYIVDFLLGGDEIFMLASGKRKAYVARERQ